MIFQETNYTLNQMESIFKFIELSKIGEFMNYYKDVVFHTENGFFAAQRDDLNNYYQF